MRPTPLDLTPLLHPRSIAVVGASDRPGAGSIVLDNLRRLGYTGQVYPINPKYRELAGWRCYPDLDSVPDPIDSVAILLGYRQVLPVLQAAAGRDIKAAWALASGFAESGSEGEMLQRKVADFCRERGIALCGPNCIGVVNPGAKAAMYSTALPSTLRAGNVGAVLQSGAVCMAVANAGRGIGFSALISSGNEAVLDNADYISYLAGDPATRVIIAFIEGFKRPKDFVAAAERAREAGKPLLVVKVGRSAVAQRATLAHTGSMAGADAVHDAVFRKHGVIRLDSLDELLEAAELFGKAPLPRGRRLAILTLSGGQIGLVGDLARGISLDLADLTPETRAALEQVLPPYCNIANPLDAWGSGNFEETYPACMEVVGRDPGVEIIAVARDSSPGIAEREIAMSNAIVEAGEALIKSTGKPVVVFANVSTGVDKRVLAHADAAGVPVLQGTRSSLRAIEALAEYAAAKSPHDFAQPNGEVGLRGEQVRRLLSVQPLSVGEHIGKQVLAAYGIPVVREQIATSTQAAVAAAASFGGPVALKIHSPDIAHKTEAGGVVLNVSGERAVREGFERIIANACAYAPDAAIEGVLVQEMAPGGIEVILGAHYDPEFGPTVIFGLGGIFVELIKDSALRLAPVTHAGAREMIEGTRAAALLRGYRGQPPADVDALTGAIVCLSHLAYELQDTISAIDVNPLLVLPCGQGVRAVDALIIKHNQESHK